MSDVEFVERARRSVRLSRQARYLYGIAGILTLLAAAWAIKAVFDIAVNFANGQQNVVWGASLVAAFMGLKLGSWIGYFIHALGELVFQQRKEQLLIDCWDSLQKILANPSIGTSPGPA